MQVAALLFLRPRRAAHGALARGVATNLAGEPVAPPCGAPPLTATLPRTPWLRDLHATLAAGAHGFALNAAAAQITPLARPHEFYDTLLASIGRAEARVSLAALYLGTGELERRLVLEVDRLLTTKPNVTVTLLFDGRRVWRQVPITSAAAALSAVSPHPGSAPGPVSSASTVSLLQPLLARHGARLKLRTLTLPAAARAASLALPPPLGVYLPEVAGVFHMKLFACDDEVLISGGNLSHEYFVDRADRYVHFGRAPALAAFAHNALNALGDCGDAIGADGKVRSEASMATSEGEGGEAVAHSEWQGRLNDIFVPQHAKPRPGTPTAISAPLPEPLVMDTWVFPTAQCGPVGFAQDAWATGEVLRAAAKSARDHLPASPTVRLSTAYLNPSPALLGALKGCSAEGCSVDVMTAHADSHGFRSAKGLMSLVPACYQHITETRVAPALMAAARGDSGATGGGGKGPMRLLAYRRAHWTFHAKGIWVRSDAIQGVAAPSGTLAPTSVSYSSSLPSLPPPSPPPSPSVCAVTVMGSSNYGRRSTELDLEAQFVVLTEAQGLAGDLDVEWAKLQRHCLVAFETDGGPRKGNQVVEQAVKPAAEQAVKSATWKRPTSLTTSQPAPAARPRPFLVPLVAAAMDRWL